jgi:hypothetical protein
MIFSADQRRRPRRFFRLRGVVRRLRRPDAGNSVGSRREPSIDADRAQQSERARFAASVDLELRLACRSEAALRRELGGAARAFVRRRAYRRLGFVRLSDYARERLGVSARTLQSAAWLAIRLDELPAVSRAYDRSELSWAQARAICKVAVAADEERWLALARRTTVETLERLVLRARQPDGVPADPDGEPNAIDGEPAVRWRFTCPARVRALWRRALELASRAAGEPLSDWRAVEIVAAEGSSGRPLSTSIGDRALLAALRLAHRARRTRHRAEGQDVGALDDRPTVVSTGEFSGGASCAANPTFGTGAPESPPFELSRYPSPADAPPASLDPVALDTRLVEAVRGLRTTEPRIGQLLRVVVDHRLYKSFGHPAFDDYVRERLGISVRKAWALLKIEKATLRSDDFGRAYRDGRLSWVRALSLLPVLDRTNAAAWITRAEGVTVRRLNDEVEWVLASRDALGPSVSLAPPPVDSRLPSPVVVTSPEQCRDLSPAARLQIGAYAFESSIVRSCASVARPRANIDAGDRHSASAPRQALEVCDAEVRFTGPASVVALLRDVLDAFADPAEPRSSACSDTSSPIGRARPAITTPSSPATDGAARCRRAARGGTCTIITSASARAAATTGATTAPWSARRIICTASMTVRSMRLASHPTRSNGGSASGSGSRRSSRTSATAIAHQRPPQR